jgi:hypothetical protein
MMWNLCSLDTKFLYHSYKLLLISPINSIIYWICHAETTSRNNAILVKKKKINSQAHEKTQLNM